MESAWSVHRADSNGKMFLDLKPMQQAGPVDQAGSPKGSGAGMSSREPLVEQEAQCG